MNTEKEEVIETEEDTKTEQNKPTTPSSKPNAKKDI